MPSPRKIVASPVGDLQLIASDTGIVAILWPGEDGSRVGLRDFVEDDEHPILIEAAAQLQEYFAGERRVFLLPLDFRGSDFQVAVWQALLAIPFGETRSYGQIARQIGRPDAVRAVGAANGRNPISIVAPCHRVVASDGRLTGFAGGLAAKAMLLSLESRERRLI